jgi:protein-S-isoprenylcysteine O-methyltransferase Ste14
VVRHPGYLAEIVYFSALPIVLSQWVPFTILAALSSAMAIALFVYLIRVEDRFNLKKWGRDYRQYMVEVPAVNFVKGLLKATRS